MTTDIISVFEPIKLTSCLRMINSKEKFVYPSIKTTRRETIFNFFVIKTII